MGTMIAESEVQKNDSLGLIIKILHFHQKFFERDTISCMLALTTSTSHMQSCFKIDLGLITYVVAVVRQQFVMRINYSIFLYRNSFGANQR